MDAPTYPPAAVYQAAAQAPFEFGIDTVTVKELLSSPTIRDLLFSELPGFKFLSQTAQLQTHLSNMTLRLLAEQTGAISDVQLAKVAQQIQALPASARPAP